MNESHRQLAEEAVQDESAQGEPSSEVEGAGGEPREEREFSWYGGKVDEAIVREIVKLKRQQKA